MSLLNKKLGVYEVPSYRIKVALRTGCISAKLPPISYFEIKSSGPFVPEERQELVHLGLWTWLSHDM